MAVQCRHWGAGCCAALNKGLCPWHSVGGQEESCQWGRGGVCVGLVVPPTLQLHAHTGTMSLPGTRYTRRVTPRCQYAHADMPAPCHALWLGGQHAGTVPTQPPSPSSCHRHGGGGCAHLSTTQPSGGMCEGTHSGSSNCLPRWHCCWHLLWHWALGGLTPQWAPTSSSAHASTRVPTHAPSTPHTLPVVPSPTPVLPMQNHHLLALAGPGAGPTLSP